MLGAWLDSNISKRCNWGFGFSVGTSDKKPVVCVASSTDPSAGTLTADLHTDKWCLAAAS